MASSYLEAAMTIEDLDVFGFNRRKGFFRSALPRVTFFLEVLIFVTKYAILPLLPFSVITAYPPRIPFLITIVFLLFLYAVVTLFYWVYSVRFRPPEMHLRMHWVEMISLRHIYHKWRLKKEKRKCSHGCNIPSPDHAVAKFMNDYTLMNHHGTPREDRMNFLFDENHENSTAVVGNSKLRNMALLIMASIGANIILDEQDTRRNERAIVVAGDILLMEAYQDLKTARSIVRKIDELKGGGQREVIRFFSKRIACNCLKQSYKEAKKSQPTRLGICTHCGPGKDRKKLKDCQRCKYVQYCSRKCQKAHWPEHKLDCETLRVGRSKKK